MHKMHQIKEPDVVHIVRPVSYKPSHEDMPDAGIDLFNHVHTVHWWQYLFLLEHAYCFLFLQRFLRKLQFCVSLHS